MSTAEAEPLEVGYWLSSEEHGARRLVEQAVLAEAAGFGHAMISDHVHPWVPAQGHAPFVWGVLGAIGTATSALHLATGVTSPIIRMHPVVVAHAAATAAVLLGGRFAIGVGTGERLNEHVTGAAWPGSAVRQRMLREAVTILHRLFEGGDLSFDGEYYTVDHARLFTRPEAPPPIWVAASGRHGATIAGEVGDGLIATAPAPDLVEAFEAAGGAGKVRVGQLKVCWAPTEQQARSTVLQWWPNGGLPRALNPELATPEDFAAACGLVDEATAAAGVICGPDPEPYLTALGRYAAAGFTRVYVHQIGADQEGFLAFWNEHVNPRLVPERTSAASPAADAGRLARSA